MNQLSLLQDLVARLDLYLPWLLPALETIELAVPATARILIGVLLMAWLAVLRQRTASGAARFHQALL